ncbi:hypothetical protein [Leisingera aquaemixtae]|uniref:Lipoprotein n=1 Tax=Leisingera aquaemixtae TaxID=1396826 RepID=A0A0P1HEM8_9RHOB|nr:hypothetical protein [Leisingera aquaemixtae]CUI02134.1 hypothetical protein PHA8399_04296 [Leisingera aquaemixtae]
MTVNFTKSVLSLMCCALLAACGGAPASNEMQFDNDGNGRFSGSAGADWTAQEIRTHASGAVCGNGPVAEFNVRALPTAPGYKIFSGSCANGGGSFPVAGGGQDYIVTAQPVQAAPVVATARNSPAWDGSTPFVD